MNRNRGRHRLARGSSSSHRHALAAVLLVGAALAVIGVRASPGSPGSPGTEQSAAELSISLTADPGSVAAGEDAAVTAVVRNDGPGAAGGVTVAITLPAGAVFASADPSAGSCAAGPPIACSLGALEPGSGAGVAVVASATEAGSLTFAAALKGAVEGEAQATLAVSGPSCTVVGTQADDDLAGSPGEVVCGLGGDDTMAGSDGDDVLVGGSGIDTADFNAAPSGITADLGAGAATGQGDDTLRGIENVTGSSHGDVLIGDAGPNALLGGGGVDVLAGGPGADTLDGGPGRDTVDYSDAAAGVRVNLSTGRASGEGSDLLTRVENVVGSPFADRLTGSAGSNTLEGRAGDDTLVGMGGADVLDGGPGSDTAGFPGAPAGIAADLVAGTAIGHGADRLVGIENLTGSAHDDLLTGSAGPNRLRGLGGTDTLAGGEGADTLEGGPGPDSLVGGPGADALMGGPGVDGCAQGVGAGSKDGCEVLPIGESAGLVLFQPTRSLIGVGFHESLFQTAATMRPMGRLVTNANPGKFSPLPPTDGPRYVVMGSRGRPTSATTAVDIVLPSRGPALSPVNGRVVLVRPYLLYCRFRDWQVVIRPDGRPDLRVMVLHMGSVQVFAGQRVAASVTVLGTAWSNDAPDSQQNLYFPDQYPHIHVEIEVGSAAPIPGCAL